MHIIIYGPEGSGKGTQAILLSEKLQLPIVTSGDLVRKEAQNDKTALGDVCRRSLTEGKYVPDEEMFCLWEKMLLGMDAKKGFILDGFPRNTNQADFLFETISKAGYRIDHVIYLTLSNEEAVNRLGKRNRKLFTGSTINHDDPQRVLERLKIYREKEKPLLEYFRNKNLLREVNGDQTVEMVHKSVMESISK